MAALKKACAVIGYGPGIGHSAAAKFAAEGYAVGIVGRTLAKLEVGSATIPNCKAFVGDVTDPASLTSALARVEAELGAIEALVYNAGSGVWKTYDELTVDQLDTSVKCCLHGLFTAAQYVCPKMESRGSGFVVVTGATASLRGKPKTAAFAAAKSAQRSFTQSLARQLWPKNVHVCLAIIDGGVGKRVNDVVQMRDGHINPDAIANAYYNLSVQDPSCWSFEVDLRPSVEPW